MLMNPKRIHLIRLVIASSLFFHFLLAQEPEGSSGTLSLNGTDPAEPRTRFDAYLARIEPLATGYILETTASGDWAVMEWASIGVKFPLVYADFPSTQTFEVGDIQLNALLALYRPRFEGSLDALAFGLDASLNTGDVETGTGFGQYIVAPYLAASFYPADEIMMTPIIKQFVSLDKDNQGNKRNDLSLRVNTTLTIDQVWVTLVPELLIDLEGDRENLWALRSSLGFMFNPQMGVSGDFVSQLAGEKRFNYLGQLSFRYLLP